MGEKLYCGSSATVCTLTGNPHKHNKTGEEKIVESFETSAKTTKTSIVLNRLSFGPAKPQIRIKGEGCEIWMCAKCGLE